MDIYVGWSVAILLHSGSNDINNQASDKVNTEKLAQYFIDIDKCFISFGMKEVIMVSVLPD